MARKRLLGAATGHAQKGDLLHRMAGVFRAPLTEIVAATVTGLAQADAIGGCSVADGVGPAFPSGHSLP